MLVTIFTPTYNRAYILPRLYESLCKQTIKDFEWLVVDDGSTDNTPKLVANWIEENKIIIKYHHKENGGKASAYNLAAKHACGELFLCVDSDDYLVNNAVERVEALWKTDRNKVHNEQKVIGQIYFRQHTNRTPITKYSGSVEFSTLLDFYRKHGLNGDTMLVYKTTIVSKYTFPKYEGEKFIPEAFIYDQYDDEGVLHIYKEVLYIGEYLPDGYTASIRKINHDNPRGYEVFIKQRLHNDDKIWYKITDTIRYIAIKLVMNDGRLFLDCESIVLTLLLFLPGYVFYKKFYTKYDIQLGYSQNRAR